MIHLRFDCGRQLKKGFAGSPGRAKNGTALPLGELRAQMPLPLLLRRGDQFVSKDSGETALLILVVQHHDRNYAQILFAGVALGNLALQVLHEAIRKAVKSALAACIFLVALAAVWANELDLVQLRIAVQSSPTGAAHPDGFGIMPFHRTP
jgi:hypothetical protein